MIRYTFQDKIYACEEVAYFRYALQCSFKFQCINAHIL